MNLLLQIPLKNALRFEQEKTDEYRAWTCSAMIGL